MANKPAKEQKNKLRRIDTINKKVDETEYNNYRGYHFCQIHKSNTQYHFRNDKNYWVSSVRVLK